MFQRLYFVTYFEHELENAAGKVSYAAGHFYHVAAELAEKLIGLGVAEEEKARELRLEAEANTKRAAEDAKQLLADFEARKRDHPKDSNAGADGVSAGSATAEHET